MKRAAVVGTIHSSPSRRIAWQTSETGTSRHKTVGPAKRSTVVPTAKAVVAKRPWSRPGTEDTRLGKG